MIQEKGEKRASGGVGVSGARPHKNQRKSAYPKKGAGVNQKREDDLEAEGEQHTGKGGVLRGAWQVLCPGMKKTVSKKIVEEVHDNKRKS